MKNRIFLGGLLILFMIELVVLILFALPKPEKIQDTVAVNEVVKTVQDDWDSLEEHRNHTSLEYVVTGSDGAVLYKTKENLSESMNAAISHKDTILDIEVDGMIVGRVICAGYFFYIQRVVIKPFDKMKSFAERIAGAYRFRYLRCALDF